MTGGEAVLAMIEALEAFHVPYMLVGSFSSNFYGVSRSTQDADFVVQLGPQSVRQIADHLGPAFRYDPQMSFETVTGTVRQILEVADGSFKIELFHLSEDGHDQERFRRRRRVKVLDRETYLPTVEDVVITKLRWASQGGRTKDWDDIRNVIAIQAARMDWEYVHSWCDRHGTRATLDEIRRSLPPL